MKLEDIIKKIEKSSQDIKEKAQHKLDYKTKPLGSLGMLEDIALKLSMIKNDINPNLVSYFTRAAVNALKQFPIINASVDGEDIVYHGYFDIGIAVGSPRGLVVPILRDVDKMSFAEIEMAIAIYNEKAKTGKLSIEDLTGGTFSISNGGVFGSMLSTPILNPPQSAILGMHNIKDRAVVENGEIVIRPMMYLALSYDHRIIDGHDAVLFLVAIKQAIEDPARMLLNV